MLSLSRRRQERALGRYWDAFVSNEERTTNELSPETKAILARLHALSPDAQPNESFLDALEGRLLKQTTSASYPVTAATPTAVFPRPTGVVADNALSRPSPWRRTSRRAWPVMELAAVILLLLLLGGYFAGVELPHRAATGHAGAGGVVYVGESIANTDPLQQELTPLDPASLQNVAGQPTMSLGDPKASPIWAYWNASDPTVALAASADGTTLAQIEPIWANATPPGADATQIRRADSATGSVILIRDTKQGVIRARLSTPGPAAYPFLNRDGSRVIVHSLDGRYWVAYDTLSGRQFPVIDLGTSNYEGTTITNNIVATAIDPAGTHLFAILGQPSPTATPKLGELVVYDLERGGQPQRVSLPNIPAGMATFGHASDGEPIQHLFAPGLAVSPDGRMLAIAHSESDAMTLLDTVSLKETRTFTPAPETSLLDRVLAWLPLQTERAAAKGMADVSGRQVMFSPNGRMLYIINWTGFGEFWDSRVGVGLRAVDLASGTLTANLPNLPVTAVMPSLDGQSIYVVGFRTSGGGGEYLLRRLDGRTLQTLAQCVFPDFRWVVVTR